MVGELNLAIADQNATVEFAGDEISLYFPDYKTAREMMRHPMPSLKLLGRLLSWSELRLKARVGERKPFELIPDPSWIVRLLSPAIREIILASKS